MKKYILFLLSICCLSGYSQKLNFHYDFTKPLGEQSDNISSAHGFGFGFEHKLKKSPFSVGAEFTFNMYGIKVLEQELPFHNGYITKTDVHYTTSFNTYAGLLKLQPASEKNIKPYGIVKAGVLHYHSNMTIDDPDDPLGCKVLEKKVLVKDFTWMASGGAGINVDWQLFKPKSESKVQLDLGVIYTMGGAADYLQFHKNGEPADPKARQYYVKFEHIPTAEVHEHAVGQVYNTITQMLTIRLGVRLTFD